MTNWYVTTLVPSGSGLAKPYDLVCDPAGDAYLVEMDNHRVSRVSPDGTRVTIAGGVAGYADGLGTAAQFNQPRCIARDPAGNLYVTDSGGNRVRKIAPDGNVTTIAGTGGVGGLDGPALSATFNNLIGIARDDAGNLYLAEQTGNRVRKLDTAGQVTTVAGSGAAGAANGVGTAATFNAPAQCAVTPDGATLYVADQSNGKIRKIDLATATVSDYASVPTVPIGVEINPANGWVYATSYSGQRIYEIAPPVTPAYNASGAQPTVIAGTGSAAYTDNTWGATAAFQGPSGITHTPTGEILVCEYDQGRIRKITPQGILPRGTVFAEADSSVITVTIPAATRPGDQILARLSHATNSGTNAPQATTCSDAGFTLLNQGSEAAAFILAETWTKIAQDGDAGKQVTFTVPAPATARTTAYVGVYYNGSTRAPISVWPNTLDNGTTSASPPFNYTFSAGRRNLALGKPTTASSQWSGNYVPSYATDASTGTRWASVTGAPADPSWLQVDLGSPQTFDQIVIIWQQGAKSFQFQVSDDATNWTTIYSTTTGDVGNLGDAGRATQTFAVPGARGRYVRFYGTVRNANEYSIADFQANQFGATELGGLSVLLGSANGPGSAAIQWSTTAPPAGSTYRGQVNIGGNNHALGVADTPAPTAAGAKTYNWPTSIAGNYLTTVAVIPPKQGTANLDVTVDTATAAGYHVYPDNRWRLSTVTTGLFASVRGVVQDAQGNLYVSGENGANAGRIMKIAPDGTVSTFAGSTAGYADGPALDGAQFSATVRGMVFDPAGNLYVCDVGNFRLRKIDPAGNVTTVAGTGAAGRVNGATWLTSTFQDENFISIDDAGNLYVSSVANLSVRKLGIDGPVRDVSAGTSAPSSHCVTPDGKYLYITYSGYTALYRYEIATAAFGAVVDGPFTNAQGVVWDRNTGNMFVTTSQGRVWQVVPPTGTYTGWTTFPIAGTGTAGNVDGHTGPNAVGGTQLTNPWAISIGPFGDLLIGQTDGRLRKLAPQGVQLRGMAYANAAAAAKVTITVPANAKVGDTLVVAVQGSTANALTAPPPVTCSDPNLTLLRSDIHPSASIGQYLYTKFITATDPGASITFDFGSTAVANNVLADLALYHNASTKKAARVGPMWTGTASPARFDITSAPVDNSGLALLIGGSQGTGTNTWTPGSVPALSTYRGQTGISSTGTQFLGWTDRPAGSVAYSNTQTVSGSVTGLMTHAVIVAPPQGDGALDAGVTLASTGFSTGGQPQPQGAVELGAVADTPAADGTSSRLGGAGALSTAGVTLTSDGVAVKHQLGSASLDDITVTLEAEIRASPAGSGRPVTAAVSVDPAAGRHHVGTSEHDLPVEVTLDEDGYRLVTWAAWPGETSATVVGPVSLGLKSVSRKAAQTIQVGTTVDTATGARLTNLVYGEATLRASGSKALARGGDLPVEATPRVVAGRTIGADNNLPVTAEVDAEGGFGTLHSARMSVTAGVAVRGIAGRRGTPRQYIGGEAWFGITNKPRAEGTADLDVPVELFAGTDVHQVNGHGALATKSHKLEATGGVGRYWPAQPVTAQARLQARGFALTYDQTASTQPVIVVVDIEVTGGAVYDGEADLPVAVEVTAGEGLAARFGDALADAATEVGPADGDPLLGAPVGVTAEVTVGATGHRVRSGTAAIEVTVGEFDLTQYTLLRAFVLLGITGRALLPPPGNPAATTSPRSRPVPARTGSRLKPSIR